MSKPRPNLYGVEVTGVYGDWTIRPFRSGLWWGVTCKNGRRTWRMDNVAKLFLDAILFAREQIDTDAEKKT